MKKLMLLWVACTAFGLTACADDDRPVTLNQLPAAAQQFIQTHFPNEEISYAKIERDFLEKRYEVVFVGSNKIEFYKDGRWKEVDCKYTAVPASIIPEKIQMCVDESYSGVAIEKIEWNRRRYEVKLANGLELTFNKKLTVVKIDD